MKNADAGGVTVTLTSPSGVIFTSTTAAAPAGVDGPIEWGADDTMWRLQVEPTVARSSIVAEHGDYTIKVAGVAEGAQVHAYVARTDPNMDVYTGAKLSYFVDPNWELTRSAEADCTYVDGEFDNTGSLVSRYGTLNGIATADDPSVHVAGGYILSNGRKSTYSSAGPARGRSPHTSRRSGLCDALRRILLTRGAACRRQQERRRVSPDRHQHSGSATGAMDHPPKASKTKPSYKHSQGN